MKKVTLVLFSFFAFGMSVHAQSIFDKAAEDAAIVICNCVNKAYKSVDEIVADEDGSKGKIFEECMDSNTEKMKKKYDNLEQQPGFSEEMMFNLMLEKLAVKEKCELANMMMQISKETETEETESEDESEDE